MLPGPWIPFDADEEAVTELLVLRDVDDHLKVALIQWLGSSTSSGLARQVTVDIRLQICATRSLPCTYDWGHSTQASTGTTSTSI